MAKKTGRSSNPAYHCWYSMLDRCLNSSAISFRNYGARGISVCDRWRTSFEDFIADVGSRPSRRHSLDRIDNSGNYEPGNVRWATSSQQNRNKSGRGPQGDPSKDEIGMIFETPIEFGGESLLPVEWSKRVGFSSSTIVSRLRRGWSVDEALTLKPINPFEEVCTNKIQRERRRLVRMERGKAS